MSIMRSGLEFTRTPLDSSRSSSEFEPGIKELLDHIAVELAAEYVRLMEAAADDGEPSPTPPD